MSHWIGRSLLVVVASLATGCGLVLDLDPSQDGSLPPQDGQSSDASMDASRDAKTNDGKVRDAPIDAADAGACVKTGEEVCNGIDDNCNGQIDEAVLTPLCDSNQLCWKGKCQPPPDASACPLVRGGDSDHLYAICDQKLAWEAARRVCLDWGGDLAVVETAVEDQFLSEQASVWSWIGYRIFNPMESWQWVGRPTSTYEGWCPDGPNQDGSYAACATDKYQSCTLLGYTCTDSAIGWDNQNCCLGRGFICERAQ